ncbi:FAD-dependent oxidoreductase [Sneathiella sp. P13V-1]|uniref:FAD-dependent oxidoreductase n=1 Tax=Sneathiella sp. P13V-1 TaxID=2697366 RepID=UPI00187B5BEC|nr:FAD-dependent oxidoreductase [Sneathiella sp. P13V-1]MBE7637035.1 FAD-dependent oxidoreductase [Sneathiella sp. P13V-1]
MGAGLKVAIIGSGPAGMYTAGALNTKCAGCEIDILDKLATPYGLIRTGVAPDHQTTKNVSRAYDKIMENGNVRFVGNVSFGDDISLETLQSLYDVVVFAIGTPKDRSLGIEGEDKNGVFGAQTFVYWYNGHPEFRDAVPHLEVENAIVIGNGNVALDVARVILSTEGEMQASDLVDHAGQHIFDSPLKSVRIVGRRGPEHAQFSTKELGELKDLETATVITDPELLPRNFTHEDAKTEKKVKNNLALLEAYSENAPSEDKRSLYLDFLLTPLEAVGDEQIRSLKLEVNRIENGNAVGTGEVIEVPCDLLVTCIGYELTNVGGLPVENGVVKNTDGRVSDGLYVVGWAKRGPSGTIGTNRIDSQNVVDLILEDHCGGPDPEKPGSAGLDKYCKENQIHTVSFEDWQKINQAEQDRAGDESPRKKFVRKRDMLTLLSED